MSDLRHLIEPYKLRLGDAWGDVLASFDGGHSAVKWLSQPHNFLDGATPMALIQGDCEEKERVMAVLRRMDGIRIG